MKKLSLFVLFFLGLIVCVNGNSPVKESLKGIWEYRVPDAPYEYSTGTFVFGEVDGKPTLTVKFKSGAEVKAKDVRIENDSVIFSVTVEYELVKVTGKLADNRITGKASSSQGVMGLTAEKAKKKTN